MTPDRETLSKRLSQFQHREITEGTQAAVALLVCEIGYGSDLPGMPGHTHWNNSSALLLTKRSLNLKNHAGQWALPGGRVETGEALIDTAIRETREEINLCLSSNDYMGRLDDYLTHSGFNMSGLVFWAGAARNASPAPAEVASIHRIPFTELTRDDAPILSEDELYQSGAGKPHHPVLRMPVGNDWIAAPTAALLYQFREVCLFGRSTRVAHFEQPEFAWR